MLYGICGSSCGFAQTHTMIYKVCEEQEYAGNAEIERKRNLHNKSDDQICKDVSNDDDRECDVDEGLNCFTIVGFHRKPLSAQCALNVRHMRM